ncbi:MAG: HAD-IIA family hydrolase [Erysipelotrichaceae bacterium]|nr:HAD-IIA family hydrolase [Erysipelotrichaceae bacterium]
MKGYMIDLDGTMFHGKRIVDGAKEWIDDLLAHNIPFIFLTNNSSRTPMQAAQHMLDMGFEHIEPKHFYTSAMAAASYIAANYTQRKVFCIGEQGLRQALQDLGFVLVNDTEEVADFVFVGLDRQATYETYSKAVKHLVKGAMLVGTNNDRILLSEKGANVGNGSVVALFEHVIGKESVKIGKPHEPILKEALKYMNLKKEDVIIVGDNLETDIALGEKFKVETLLVLTGVHQRKDVEALNIHPTHIVDNLRELIR